MRKILIGVAVIAALAFLSGVMANPSSLGLNPDSGLVRTGADPSVTPGEGGSRGSGTAGPQSKPDAKSEQAEPQGTPMDVSTGQLAAGTDPFILVNPTSAAPGATVDISGSRFDPGATITLAYKRTESDRPTEIGFAQVDEGGSFGGVSFAIPPDFTGSFSIVARQDGNGKEAKAQVQIAAGSPQVTLGTAVGTPGTPVAFSAEGFVPGETVKVFFNSLAGEPVATFQADQSGGIRRQSLIVPYGAIGNNNFIFVGDRSQTLVTVPFLMLNLYPSVALSSYAAKADTVLTFDGEGFGPSERVRVHLNSPASPPVGFLETDDQGTFAGAGGLRIPFDLRGKNTLIFVGEKSQAAVTTSFDVLPYTPMAEASTYGGRAGTTITFYGNGFARDEIVYIYAGVTEQSEGKMVACTKSDDQGNIRAGGSYTIPGSAERGQLNFRLVGKKSQADAVATMEIIDSGGPVDVPAEEQEFVCPLDEQEAAAAQQPAPEAAPAASDQPQSSATPGSAGGEQPPTPSPAASPASNRSPAPTPPTGQNQQQTPTASATPNQSQQQNRTQTPSPAQKPTGGERR